jgi:hypothetical protein
VEKAVCLAVGGANAGGTVVPTVSAVFLTRDPRAAEEARRTALEAIARSVAAAGNLALAEKTLSSRDKSSLGTGDLIEKAGQAAQYLGAEEPRLVQPAQWRKDLPVWQSEILKLGSDAAPRLLADSLTYFPFDTDVAFSGVYAFLSSLAAVGQQQAIQAIIGECPELGLSFVLADQQEGLGVHRMSEPERRSDQTSGAHPNRTSCGDVTGGRSDGEARMA